MKNISDKANPDFMKGKVEKRNAEGYPLYPESDDIYNKFFKEKSINPEDTSKNKDQNYDKGIKNFISGADLDVPGSELDDEQETTGNEDEENNYYSLGGDAHIDLDEAKGI